MARTKLLIGNGESLVSNVTQNTGQGDKAHPYSYEERARDLAPAIRDVLDEIDDLPDRACPNDEAVVALTLHPSYLARSYHPSGMLRELGLRQVGSREETVDPMRSVRKTPITKTTELFIAGPRPALRHLLPTEQADPSETFREDFRKIETVRAPGAERLRMKDGTGEDIPLEVVLHIAGDSNDSIYLGFEDWCDEIGVEVLDDRSVGGLSFVNVRADGDALDSLVKFPFLRLARRMPRLAFRPVALRAAPTDEAFAVTLEHDTPVSDRARVAVLDGGVPHDHPFGALVNAREPVTIGAPTAEGLAHGMQVTSAALFGPIEEGEALPQPFATIDHWRVVDDEGDDFELTQALDRIVNILEGGDYDVANLSLGPDEALDDDDVHIWTATMDAIAAQNGTMIVCAAGNNGLDSADAGHNRVQPCSDGVNVLAVGARDHAGPNWARATYSAVGPGRSPGRVKPDCVAIGGTEIDPFFAISGAGRATGTMGTSFAAPTVTRLGTGLKTTFDRLTPTAVRAILLHTAEDEGLGREEVGWGSVRHDLADVIACADDEATVVFQGELGLQSMRRYPIPCPSAGFARRTEIKATFVVASPIEPEDAVSYTQVGAQILFRPDTTYDAGVTDRGRPRLHATKPFFGSGEHFQTEQELREDAHRWEAVKRQTRRFNAGTLARPVFDIQHHARSHGGSGRRDASIPYALIVTIHEKDNERLYEDILAAHTSLSAMIPGISVSTT
ncbi:MAG: S8 family peptidase [Shimia sp.]